MSSRRVEKSVPNVPLFKVKKGASFEERCIAYCKKYTLYYHVHQEQYRRYDKEHTIDEFVQSTITNKGPNLTVKNFTPKYELPNEKNECDLLIDHDIPLIEQYHQDHNQDELFTDEMNFYNLESDDSPKELQDDFMTFVEDNQDAKI